MKRVVLLTLLALALPVATWASTIGVTNKGGTIMGDNSGLSLSGSVMIAYGSAVGSNLGTVTFSTGAFLTNGRHVGGWWLVYDHGQRHRRSSQWRSF